MKALHVILITLTALSGCNKKLAPIVEGKLKK